MTGGSIRLGRILGLEVRIDYSWFLIFVLLAWILSVRYFPGLAFGRGVSVLLGIVAALLLFASVLAHEICHSLMARRLGLEVTGITLFLFGGVAQIRGEPRSPKEEFLIAVVGPLASLLIGVLCLGGWWALSGGGPPGALAAVLAYLGAVNLVLAVFNLVPGLPLDGGRVLRSAIWQFTGSLNTATRWAAGAGVFFAWLLMGYGLIWGVLIRGDLGGLWLVFIGWFLKNAAEASYEQLQLRRALSGVPVGELMETEVPTVQADVPVARFVDSYLLRHDYPMYPVCREGHFAGVVGIDDVRRLEREAWESTPVGALARPPEEELTVRESDDSWDALMQMLEADADRLLVMRDGELEGVVSRDAIAQLVRRKLRLGLTEEPAEAGRRRAATHTRGWSA